MLPTAGFRKRKFEFKCDDFCLTTPDMSDSLIVSPPITQTFDCLSKFVSEVSQREWPTTHDCLYSDEDGLSFANMFKGIVNVIAPGPASVASYKRNMGRVFNYIAVHLPRRLRRVANAASDTGLVWSILQSTPKDAATAYLRVLCYRLHAQRYVEEIRVTPRAATRIHSSFFARAIAMWKACHFSHILITLRTILTGVNIWGASRRNVGISVVQASASLDITIPGGQQVLRLSTSAPDADAPQRVVDATLRSFRQTPQLPLNAALDSVSLSDAVVELWFTVYGRGLLIPPLQTIVSSYLSLAILPSKVETCRVSWMIPNGGVPVELDLGEACVDAGKWAVLSYDSDIHLHAVQHAMSDMSRGSSCVLCHANCVDEFVCDTCEQTPIAVGARLDVKWSQLRALARHV